MDTSALPFARETSLPPRAGIVMIAGLNCILRELATTILGIIRTFLHLLREGFGIDTN